MATKKNKQPDDLFPVQLTVKQRDSLLHVPGLSAGIKVKIERASGKTAIIEFTQEELERMEEEVSMSLDRAPAGNQKPLNAVLEQVSGVLFALEEKLMCEKRRAVVKSGVVYQLRVKLEDSRPSIWRRIEVPDCTLGELHEVLQVVMGWSDYHMHQFIARKEYYGPLDPEDELWGMEKHDEEQTPLSAVVATGRRTRFIYEYDFGDSWRHEIVLEKTMKPEPGVKYPRCTGGRLACPPEDCGGVSGYTHLLDAIADPEHEHHEELLQWVGDDFDPAAFSVDEVNEELRTLPGGSLGTVDFVKGQP